MKVAVLILFGVIAVSTALALPLNKTEDKIESKHTDKVRRALDEPILEKEATKLDNATSPVKERSVETETPLKDNKTEEASPEDIKELDAESVPLPMENKTEEDAPKKVRRAAETKLPEGGLESSDNKTLPDSSKVVREAEPEKNVELSELEPDTFNATTNGTETAEEREARLFWSSWGWGWPYWGYRSYWPWGMGYYG